MSVSQSGRQMPGAPPDYKQLRQSPYMRHGNGLDPTVHSQPDRTTLRSPDGAGGLPLRPGMPPPRQYGIPQRPQHLPLRPGTSPPSQFEAPQRPQYLPYAQGSIANAPTPSLEPSFKIRKASFFCVGRVLRVLWAEPASSSSQDTYPTAFGEMVFSKVRTFVVIRASDRSSTCVPIHTYSGQGVTKAGVESKEHCIVYIGSQPPVNGRTSGETLSPIRVDPDHRQARLDPSSRINFGKIYTIEHNIKVANFGVVNRADLPTLESNFRTAFLSAFTKPDQGKSVYQLKSQPNQPKVGKGKEIEDPDDSNGEEEDDDGNPDDDDDDDDEYDGEA